MLQTDIHPRLAAPRRGRPSRMSVQDIIRVANEIGLSTVTLREIAERLGVSISALYRHVKSREELLSLAAFEVSLKRRMPDAGAAQWTDIAKGYAFGMFDLLVAEPQLINAMMNGTLGLDAEVDFVDQFIGMLKQHGFTARQAIGIHHSVAMLAVGAAVGTVAIHASYSTDHSREDATRELLDQRPADELVEIRNAFAAYVDVGPQHLHRALEQLLAGVAAGRAGSTRMPASSKLKPEKAERRRSVTAAGSGKTKSAN